MDDRSYILQRLQSKKVSIEEFNFDALQAPPLGWFLSPYDISMLHEMAHSLKLSAQPDIKLKEMDSLLRSRGLVKFGAGTNRIVYRHPEFQDILFKIAYDDVGLGDNPAEFRNQMLLKPFVSKMFEVSKCGTVSVVERLVPIKSREEFLSIADDYFTLLTEFILGTYIMADIGSKFFMNTAIREAFGVCLIDYPYVYELDGNKLFCRKPDPQSQSGKCDGIIDYDDGYNYLQCTKCGAIYKAKELKKNIDSGNIKIEKEEGEYTMNIKISGGSKRIEETKVTTNQDFQATHFKQVKKTMPVAKKPEKKVEKTVNGIQVNNQEESKAPTDKEIDEILDMNNSESPMAKYVEEKTEEMKEYLEQKKQVTSPFEMSEDIKQEALANKEEEPEKNPNDLIDEAIRTITDNLDKIKLDAVKYQFIERLIKILVENNITTRMFEILISQTRYVYLEADDDTYEEICDNEDLLGMLEKVYEISTEVTDVEFEDHTNSLNVRTATNIMLAYEYGIDDRKILKTITNSNKVENISKIFTEPEKVAEVQEDNAETETVKEYEAPATLSFYDAKVINLNTIFPNQSSKRGQDIIVFTDSNGNYVANDNGIIAADIIDEVNVNDIEVCSKEWVSAARSILDSNEPIDPPVGVVPPQVDNPEEEAPTENEEVEANKPMTMEEFMSEEDNQTETQSE